MSVSIIVAIADDGSIGRGGTQPFFVSADLRHFKELTMGHPIIMGRKTFEALPKGALPGRRNIVVSRNLAYAAPGAEVVPSLEAALALVRPEDAFVIGGASVYTQALPLAQRLYITRIHALCPDADTHFPPIPAGWRLVDQSPLAHDDKSGLDYQFESYVKP